MKRKLKPDVFCLVGAIFTIVGLVFVPFGIWAVLNADAFVMSPGSDGDASVLGLIFLAVGAVQGCLGLALIGHWLRRERMRDKALSSGVFVYGKIVSVQEDWSQVVNGLPCAFPVAEAEIGSQPRLFEGSRVRDPRMLPEIGTEVKIHMDQATGAYAITDMGGNVL